MTVLLAAAAAHAAPALRAAPSLGPSLVPRLAPDRDVTIDYQVTPEGRAPLDVTVAAMAGGRFLRVTSDALPTTILVNRDTGRAAIVLPMLRMYADAKIGKYDPERSILQGASFTRLGERDIAGRRCTQWRAVSADGQAEACITPEGVILRGSANSNRRGPLGGIEARRVVYGRLAPEVFQVPQDFQKSPVAIDPQGLPGLGQ